MLAEILARRDQQIYMMLALAAAVGVAVYLAVRFAPPRWRGPVQVFTAVLLALPQVALILQ